MIDGGLAPIICKTAYISHCYQPVSSLWLPSPLRYLDPGARVQSDQRLLECWRVSRKVIFEGRKDTHTGTPCQLQRLQTYSSGWTEAILRFGQSKKSWQYFVKFSKVLSKGCNLKNFSVTIVFLIIKYTFLQPFCFGLLTLFVYK